MEDFGISDVTFWLQLPVGQQRLPAGCLPQIACMNLFTYQFSCYLAPSTLTRYIFLQSLPLRRQCFVCYFCVARVDVGSGVIVLLLCAPLVDISYCCLSS
jgi:hypothetical protein